MFDELYDGKALILSKMEKKYFSDLFVYLCKFMYNYVERSI